MNDAPPRRLPSAAGAHDAWETARPFYATTNLLAASLVLPAPPRSYGINVSYQRSRGAAGVSQLQRSHRRRRGEVPERLPGRRPLRLGETVGGRDDDE